MTIYELRQIDALENDDEEILKLTDSETGKPLFAVIPIETPLKSKFVCRGTYSCTACVP